jgi:hypothetical protein
MTQSINVEEAFRLHSIHHMPEHPMGVLIVEYDQAYFEGDSEHPNALHEYLWFGAQDHCQTDQCYKYPGDRTWFLTPEEAIADAKEFRNSYWS